MVVLTNVEVNHEELGRAHDPNQSLHLFAHNVDNL